jgi:mitochondrial fission protein ELM1
MNKDIKLWVITEGMAGTENQCLAIAECLAPSSVEVKRVTIAFPFNYLCPLVFKTAPKWAIKGIDWNGTVPDIIIASGRKAIAPTLKFKDAFKAFIQDPRINPNHFDLCAIPNHDKTRGSNVIVTTAAPNRITQKSLDIAKSNYDFSYLPPKRVAILIGGNSKTHTMPDAFAHALHEQLMPYLQSDEYGFMITASRRTPQHVQDDLKSLFNNDKCAFWNGDGENPYHSYLAHAGTILVTEDSTSMLSDALTTGKPTYRLPLDGGSEKFDRLYATLSDHTGLTIFDGEMDHYDYTPLNDAKLVADEIKKRFEKRNITT